MAGSETGFNPFPDYPVTRLQEDTTEVRSHTLQTPEIKDIAARVREWAHRWQSPEAPDQKPKPSIVSIRGDYGSGKTHLLVYAISELAVTLKDYKPGYTVLRAASLETDPLSWYRETISPAIAAAGLPEMMRGIYAEAGKVIARAARLTEGGEQVLTETPQAIFTMVRDSLLDRNAVDEQMLKFLVDAGATSQDVRQALAGLVWGETETSSLNWLCAKPLSMEQRAQIKVSDDVKEPETVSAVLEGIAAVHAFLKRPFVFIVDELEHLVQFDLSRNSRIATTWLKRLVELLAAQGALIMLSGHWDAWLGQTDLRDRLPGMKPIELPVLSPPDVVKMVDEWVTTGAISTDQATVIVEVTQGNRRKILSLCRSLYEKSGKFRSVLTLEAIRNTADDIAQKLTIEGAALAILGILEKLGLRTERPGTVRGVDFNLVGLRGSQAKVVVDIRHSTTQVEQLAEANDFLEKAKDLPEVIGCFLSDGAVNPEVPPLFANKNLKRFVYDLNQRDVVARIRDDLVPLLSAAPGASHQQAEQLSAQSAALSARIVDAEKAQDTEEANRLKQQRDAVEKQLNEMRDLYAQATGSLQEQLRVFEARRAEESAEFQERLNATLRAIVSPREQAVVGTNAEPEDSPVRTTYRERTQPPLFSKRLRFGMNLTVIGMLGAAFLLGLALYLDHSAWLPLLTAANYFTLKLVTDGAILFLILGSGWVLLHRISQFDELDEYHNRLLHEIYVRRGSASDLIRADNIIRLKFEENINHIEKARRLANEALAHEFPDVYAYLAPDAVPVARAAQWEGPSSPPAP